VPRIAVVSVLAVVSALMALSARAVRGFAFDDFFGTA
jgi:hypothetical protein